MKKTSKSIPTAGHTQPSRKVRFAAIISRPRQGWRCYYALAGVFALRKLLCIITAGMLLLYTACDLDSGDGTPGLEFEPIDGGTAYSVTGCDKSATAVIIPAAYKGLPVTSIGLLAFDGYGNVTSITIPASVTSIGNAAFKDCTSLTSLTIPASVTSIGQYAFNMCISITSISIPASVISMGDHAFYQWGYTQTQTIYIQGHASEAAADAAWGGSSWRDTYGATFVYQGQ